MTEKEVMRQLEGLPDDHHITVLHVTRDIEKEAKALQLAAKMKTLMELGDLLAETLDKPRSEILPRYLDSDSHHLSVIPAVFDVPKDVVEEVCGHIWRTFLDMVWYEDNELTILWRDNSTDDPLSKFWESLTTCGHFPFDSYETYTNPYEQEYDME